MFWRISFGFNIILYIREVGFYFVLIFVNMFKLEEWGRNKIIRVGGIFFLFFVFDGNCLKNGKNFEMCIVCRSGRVRGVDFLVRLLVRVLEIVFNVS